MVAGRLDQMQQGKLNVLSTRGGGDLREIKAMGKKCVAIKRQPLSRILTTTFVDPLESSLVF